MSATRAPLSDQEAEVRRAKQNPLASRHSRADFDMASRRGWRGSLGPIKAETGLPVVEVAGADTQSRYVDELALASSQEVRVDRRARSPVTMISSATGSAGHLSG
jgi:hypothetical protein